MKREEFSSSHVREALSFAFYPSTLVYNLVVSSLICLLMFFFAYGQDSQSMNLNNAVISSTQALSLSPALVFFLVSVFIILVFVIRDVQIFFTVVLFASLALLSYLPTVINLIILKKQGIIDDNKNLKTLYDVFHSLIFNENMSAASYGTGLLVLVCSFIFLLFLFIRGADITAQLAEEDFGRPSWGIGVYLPLKVLGKFALIVLFSVGAFLLSIWLLSLAIFAVDSEWSLMSKSIFSAIVFFEMLWFVWFYPTIVLTLVRTKEFFKTLSMKENYKTIDYYVGKKNYIAMASLMTNVVMMFLFYAIVIEVWGINLITLAITFVICFCTLHFLVAIHYLIGLLSGYAELLQEEENEYELDFDDMLDDVKICIRNGYPDDAITLLTNVIDNKTESPKAQLTMYQYLINSYKIVGDERKILETRQRMIDYTFKEVPWLEKKVLPVMVDLFMNNQLTPETNQILPLVKAAYATNRHEAIPKLVQDFEKNNPNHPDIVDNYFHLALVLASQKNYAKAYKILGYLLKKYPKSPRIIDVRSEYKAVKYKLDSKGVKGKLAES